MKKITSRQFNQDTGGAKRATKEGPVIITDRGEPAHVLMSFDDYRRLTGPSLLEVAAQEDGSDFAFDTGAFAVQKTKTRQFGALKGVVSLNERFFEPLPADELAAWGET